jgi:type VI protein secretion system component Hcp
MDDNKSDMVMKFVTQDGKDMESESTLDKLAGDPLMQDFVPIKQDYNDYSNFFEIQSFSFSMKLAGDDTNVGPMKQSGIHVARDEFSSWRSVKTKELGLGNDKHSADSAKRYPVEFDTFTFTRQIDSTTPYFFNACCYQKSFKSAALVRRIATGGAGAANSTRQSVGHIRFDFSDVLITSLDWSDGDLVTETCAFICKAMRVLYRQQSFGGDFTTSFIGKLDASGWRAKGGADMSGAIQALWDQQKDGAKPPV